MADAAAGREGGGGEEEGSPDARVMFPLFVFSLYPSALGEHSMDSVCKVVIGGFRKGDAGKREREGQPTCVRVVSCFLSLCLYICLSRWLSFLSLTVTRHF